MRFLLFDGGTVETLSYFSKCMTAELRAMGQEVLLFDIADETDRLWELRRFLAAGDCTMLTFNFSGLQQEAIFYDASGRLLWDVYGVRCINIVVDHPLYYYKELQDLPERYAQVSIDRGHEDYMRRYYPGVRLLGTMPLAGSRPGQEMRSPDSRRPISERGLELVFTGNYTPPEYFEPYITRNGEEYERFYRSMLDDFFSDPGQETHQVMERHIRAELGELSADEMTQAVHSLMFLDLYVRFFYRGEAVRRLTEGGLAVHVFGSGWEQLATKRKDRLVCHGSRTSAGCLEALSDAKLSLNVMPWFKQGAHDRIYNSMYCGAVSLTDTSRYLRATLTDWEEVVFYDLTELEKLPEKAAALLSDGHRMQGIADAGFRHVCEYHTWERYVRELLAAATR